ncbi:MAG TPA: sulfur carrier protein ThiS [Pseudolabrys sp.]|nr:sulfur carrier protein ThiS [Pseudolabrys sp.]
MRVTVNGEDTEVVARDLAGLLDELEYEFTQLAIAVNFNVVPRARWAETALNAGDRVEIITPRQGG